MSNILINGFSAKAGGGKNIIDNYLIQLQKNKKKTHTYFVLVYNYSSYVHFENDRIKIIDIPKIFKNSLFLPFFYTVYIKYILKKLKIDLIFNFADIIFPVSVKQIYFFDWAYLVYPNSVIWSRMNFKSYIVRKIKLILIQYLLKYPTKVISQTAIMSERLQSIYDLKNVVTIQSALSLDNYIDEFNKSFNLPEGKQKLLFLSNFAPHKNFDILPKLLKLFKEKNKTFLIITTLDMKSKEVNKLFKRFKNEGTDKYILNIGHINSKDIPSLFKQCDALFFPTLLESFGLPFLEAMYHKSTIFTSDYDFTRCVCGDAAFYFDPLDEISILNNLDYAFINDSVREKKIKDGSGIIQSFDNWEVVFDKYEKCIDNTLKDK